MDFEDEFDRVAKLMTMSLDRARKNSTHPGLKGDSAESIVRSFLIKYLPKNLEISTGHIFDINKKFSNQIDIIIHEKSRTPIMYLNEEKQLKLIPVECVYSVIEVKSFLNKTELTKKRGVFDNMYSVRDLEKKAFYEEGAIKCPTENYGQSWKDWPINYFVFAFNSTSLKTIAQQINDYHIKYALPPERRIDMVCVLGKGLVVNQTDEPAMNACPNATSTLKYIETKKEILLFYGLMSQYFLQVYMRKFNFIYYIKEISFSDK